MFAASDFLSTLLVILDVVNGFQLLIVFLRTLFDVSGAKNRN